MKLLSWGINHYLLGVDMMVIIKLSIIGYKDFIDMLGFVGNTSIIVQILVISVCLLSKMIFFAKKTNNPLT
jgi:hypothetical protein